jgi:hypothetical protein
MGPGPTHEDVHGTSRHFGMSREALTAAAAMTADQDGSVPHEETAHASTSTYDDPTEDLV